MSNSVTNACKRLVLTAPQKSVLMCLADRSDDDGLAWLSLPGICEWTCLSRTAVIHAVKALERDGFIQVERTTGRNNRVTIQLEVIANQCATRTGTPDAPVRPAHPTSTPDAPPPVRQAHGSSAPGAPDTSIHQEDTKDISTSGKPAVPECPHRDLIDLFKKQLPELAQPRPELWSGKNADAMRARWRWVLTARKGSGERYAESRQEAVDFFARFFEHVAESDFLCGRAGKWSCDLGWLMKTDNFAKVVQGNYDNKTTAASARKEHA